MKNWWDETLTMGKLDEAPCILCGGTAGMKNERGQHQVCALLAARGAPTPCLGMHCGVCNGSGTTGKGGAMLSFDLGPQRIARALAAQFPTCIKCKGKGHTEGETK